MTRKVDQRIIRLDYPTYQLTIVESDLLKYFGSNVTVVGDLSDDDLLHFAKTIIKTTNWDMVGKVFEYHRKTVNPYVGTYMGIYLDHIGYDE